MSGEELKDLYIVGTGINGLRQLTQEARDILVSCRKVFHLTLAHDELAELCSDVESNASLYWTGERQRVAYERIVDKVIAEVEKGPGVANVIYGHPLFFDDINMKLIRIARERNLRYKVVPGVSCLDTLSVDLEIDYGDGAQVFEAQDLVYRRHALNPRIHAVILQIGQFGSNLTIPKVPQTKGRFTPLEQHLLKYYPPDHPVKVVFSRQDDTYDRFEFECAVTKIDDNRERIFKGTTLYVPPVA